jgi:hypothetical protein
MHGSGSGRDGIERDATSTLLLVPYYCLINFGNTLIYLSAVIKMVVGVSTRQKMKNVWLGGHRRSDGLNGGRRTSLGGKRETLYDLRYSLILSPIRISPNACRLMICLSICTNS